MTTTPPADGGLHPRVLSYDPRRGRSPLCSRTEWEEVRPLVLTLVSALPEASGPGVRRYLTVSTRLAVHAFRHGWPLEPEQILSPAALDHFVANLPGSHATFRSQLRKLAAAHGLEAAPGGLRFPARDLRAPYDPSEVEALWRFASALSNRQRRLSLQGLLVLGAGFGLARADLRGVTAAHLHTHGRRMHLVVPSDGRCVPAAAGWGPRARRLAAERPSGQLIGRPAGTNLTTRHVEWVGDRAGVPRLSPDRLRACWLVGRIAAGVPLPQLLAESGVRTAGSLDGYLKFLPAPRSACTLSGR